MIALLSTQVANEFAKKTGIEVLALKEYSRLDTPVSSHADMLICKIENTVFCYEDYYLENRSIFEKIENNYKVVKVSKNCSRKYPNDVGLNALVIGKKIFSRLDSTAKEIVDYAEENGYKLVNVNQGYSACSTLVLNEGSAITTDISIYKALINEGCSALLVTSESLNPKVKPSSIPNPSPSLRATRKRATRASHRPPIPTRRTDSVQAR